MARNRLVGQSLYSNEPICANYDEPTHTLITGPTGSGKTTLAMHGQIEQDAMDGDRPIVVFLFKEDEPFFRLLSRTAKRQRLPFKYFSTNPRKPTHVCNPLMQEHIESMTPAERMQHHAMGMGLVSGHEHGRDFWAANNVEFARLVFGKEHRRSFVEARDFIETPKGREALRMSDRMRDNMSHGFINLNQFAEIAAANATPELVPASVWEARITHREMCMTPGIYVFMSSSFIQATTGELMLHFIFTSHLAAIEATPGALPTSMYIDEFQRALRPSFPNALEQARGRNVSITLAHQTISQLRTADRDFTDTILTNTGVKVFLPPYQDKPTADTLAHIGGEVSRMFRGESWGDDGKHIDSLREGIVPRLGVEELNVIASTPHVGIVVQRPGRGLAVFKHPAVTRMQFVVSSEEYAETLNDPWPGSPEETILAADIKPPPPPPTPTIEQRKRDMPGGGMFADEPPPVESPEPKSSRARADKSHKRPKRPKS